MLDRPRGSVPGWRFSLRIAFDGLDAAAVGLS